VSEERAEIRREVIAELVEYAKRRAASYAENYEAAVEHGPGRDGPARRLLHSERVAGSVAVSQNGHVRRPSVRTGIHRGRCSHTALGGSGWLHRPEALVSRVGGPHTRSATIRWPNRAWTNPVRKGEPVGLSDLRLVLLHLRFLHSGFDAPGLRFDLAVVFQLIKLVSSQPEAFHLSARLLAKQWDNLPEHHHSTHRAGTARAPGHRQR
jgi:hypothetical protein